MSEIDKRITVYVSPTGREKRGPSTGELLAWREADASCRMERGMVEHVVSRVNEHYYVCEVCGKAGSERWAILHQFPADQLMHESEVRCINPACGQLRGELHTAQVLLAETRSQLSDFITDFCALRDALPREQVEQLLTRVDL